MLRFDFIPIYDVRGKICDWVLANIDELAGMEPRITPDEWWD
jgi:hypothetical protein